MPLHLLILGIPAVIALLMAILGIIYLWNTIRYRLYRARRPASSVPPLPVITDFTIQNPYAVTGRYYKAQLHLHTSNSKDVHPKLPVEDTLRRYQSAGYQVVAITDHDVTTRYDRWNCSEFMVLAGEERTIPGPCWPLGKHLVLIEGAFPQDRLLMPAHPNWQGNLGTGCWYLSDLLKLPDLHLLEIYNHHSDYRDDLRLWEQLLRHYGPAHPVWGVAVDDSDNAVMLDRGWIMVKAEHLTKEAFLKALRRGSFYATTGPSLEFQVKADMMIQVNTPVAGTIRFLNHQGKVVGQTVGVSGEYRPRGDEGFIRAELEVSGRFAWSQPFFIVPSTDRPRELVTGE